MSASSLSKSVLLNKLNVDGDAKINRLVATTIEEVENLEVTNVNATTVTATTVTATDVNATTVNATDVNATNVTATTVTATDVIANDVKAKFLQLFDVFEDRYRAVYIDTTGNVRAVTDAPFEPDGNGLKQAVSMWFLDNENALALFGNIATWNVSAVEDFSSLFEVTRILGTTVGVNGCTYSAWGSAEYDTTNATVQKVLDLGTTVNLGLWNTSSATDMTSMFSTINASNDAWGTPEYAPIASTTFPAISTWNIANVTSVQEMFAGQSYFNQALPISASGNLTNTRSMFINFSTTNDNFVGTFNDGSITSWNMSNVTDIISMFSGQPDFNQDISGWNLGEVVEARSFMSNCMARSAGDLCKASAFNQDLSAWTLPKLENAYLMFAGNPNLNLGNVSTWCTTPGILKNMNTMFGGSNLPPSFVGINAWDTSGVTDMAVAFGIDDSVVTALQDPASVAEYAAKGYSAGMNVIQGYTGFDVTQVASLNYTAIGTGTGFPPFPWNQVGSLQGYITNAGDPTAFGQPQYEAYLTTFVVAGMTTLPNGIVIADAGASGAVKFTQGAGAAAHAIIIGAPNNHQLDDQGP